MADNDALSKCHRGKMLESVQIILFSCSFRQSEPRSQQPMHWRKSTEKSQTSKITFAYLKKDNLCK